MFINPFDLGLIVLIAVTFIVESRLEKFGYSSGFISFCVWLPIFVVGTIAFISSFIDMICRKD